MGSLDYCMQLDLVLRLSLALSIRKSGGVRWVPERGLGGHSG